MLLQPTKIQITEKQKAILEKLSKGTHVKLNLKTRATIILFAVENKSNGSIARTLNSTTGTVRRWRNKWAKMYSEIQTIEKENSHKLKAKIESALSDNHRSGRNPTFTPEQVTHIIHLSLQSPESVGVPITHWTSAALARKSVELDIVENISPRQVGRFLKRYGFKTPSI